MTRPENLIHSEFMHNLGSDHLAVNAGGHVVGRASSAEAIRRAVPDAACYLTAEDLAGDVGIPDAIPEPEQNPVAAGLDAVKAQSAFDHDGDGAEGGSMAGEASTAHKGAVKRAAAKAKK